MKNFVSKKKNVPPCTKKSLCVRDKAEVSAHHRLGWQQRKAMTLWSSILLNLCAWKSLVSGCHDKWTFWGSFGVLNLKPHIQHNPMEWDQGPQSVPTLGLHTANLKKKTFLEAVADFEKCNHPWAAFLWLGCSAWDFARRIKRQTMLYIKNVLHGDHANKACPGFPFQQQPALLLLASVGTSPCNLLQANLVQSLFAGQAWAEARIHDKRVAARVFLLFFWPGHSHGHMEGLVSTGSPASACGVAPSYRMQICGATLYLFPFFHLFVAFEKTIQKIRHTRSSSVQKELTRSEVSVLGSCLNQRMSKFLLGLNQSCSVSWNNGLLYKYFVVWCQTKHEKNHKRK